MNCHKISTQYAAWKGQDLVVRTGGYSDYFNRLTPELKQTVLKRTEFGA